jgi:hypothetical protein
MTVPACAAACASANVQQHVLVDAKLVVQVALEHVQIHAQVDAQVHAVPAVPVVVREAVLAVAVASVTQNVLAVRVAALGDVNLIVRTTASMDVIQSVSEDVPRLVIGNVLCRVLQHVEVRVGGLVVDRVMAKEVEDSKNGR